MMRIFKQSYSDSYKLSYSDNYKLSYSDLFRVSIDPRVKPEGDRKESVPEGDERGRKPEGNNFYIVIPRFGTNRHGIFELMKNIKLSLRGACLRATWQSQQNANNQPRCSRQSLGLPQHDNYKKSSLRAGTRGQAIFELVFFTLVSSTSIAQAECVPLPDCASIGYTASSCEGGFVRCPFDITKLYCMPCDTKYKYACSGTGQVGNGESCNGKYVSCECAEGCELVDGNCIVSCAYTLTTLPTGCSAVDDSCIKNGTTYYSPTCTSCKTGYTINSGSCSANTCSGYYASKTGCKNYTTCQSGTITTYKCTACETGYTFCENTSRCIDTNCYTTLIGNVDSCTDFEFEYCNKTYSCYGNYGEAYTAIPSNITGFIACTDFSGGVEP